MKRLFQLTLLLLLAGISYLFVAPVAIEPIAWQAPANPGYNGDFAENNKLANLQHLTISPYHGPEDIVTDAQGRLYVSVHEGKILRLYPEENRYEVFAENLGRPLGLAFDAKQNLLVADAYLGLLSISAQAEVSVLADSFEAEPIVYANNIAVHNNGTIYFTEASTKYGAKAFGGSYPASLLDLMEHCACGRVFAYKPAQTPDEKPRLKLIAEGLYFANGLALSADQNTLYVNETGMYRVNAIALNQPNFPIRPFIENLPSFPDNLSQGQAGKIWLGLVSPRNPLLDALSTQPFWRKVIQRFPKAIRPKATFYGHVIAFNDKGEIVQNLQDPSGAYPTNTGVLELDNRLYIASLTAKNLSYLNKD